MTEQINQWFGPYAELAHLVALTLLRLIVAGILGGVIGLEREFKRKPAGLRTNMFICFGSAMFTILSGVLAGRLGGDHTRIAAQIIPGIGFIGAGSILHSRGSVTGLTTAATIFVVASIGMAVGGGFYLPAIFATIVIFLSLHFLGWFEKRWNLKPLTMAYEALGANAEQMISEINAVLEEEKHLMQTVQVGRSNGDYRVQFTVEGTWNEHQTLLSRLHRLVSLKKVETEQAPERE